MPAGYQIGGVTDDTYSNGAGNAQFGGSGPVVGAQLQSYTGHNLRDDELAQVTSPDASIIAALKAGDFSGAIGLAQLQVQMYGAAGGPVGAALLRFQQQIDVAEQQVAKGVSPSNCQAVAQAGWDALSKAGLNPQFVRLQSIGSDYIVPAQAGPSITQNGLHYAVLAQGVIYDAFTGAQGVAQASYLSLFASVGKLTLTPIGNALPP